MEAMKARQLQGGLSLLVLAILLALSGFALAQFNAAGQYRQKLNLEQLARQNQVLDHIRAGLFGFTAQQGLHSQSHLGHLPCPGHTGKQHCTNHMSAKTMGVFAGAQQNRHELPECGH
jgi:hypothetical protein